MRGFYNQRLPHVAATALTGMEQPFSRLFSATHVAGQANLHVALD